MPSAFHLFLVGALTILLLVSLYGDIENISTQWMKQATSATAAGCFSWPATQIHRSMTVDFMHARG